MQRKTRFKAVVGYVSDGNESFQGNLSGYKTAAVPSAFFLKLHPALLTHVSVSEPPVWNKHELI